MLAQSGAAQSQITERGRRSNTIIEMGEEPPDPTAGAAGRRERGVV